MNIFKIFKRNKQELQLKVGDRLLLRKVVKFDNRWYYEHPIVEYAYFEGTITEISPSGYGIAVNTCDGIIWYSKHTLPLFEKLNSKEG